MIQHVAILRGINVGGKRKILMADLRSLMLHLGFSDILTYIQSGNVLFKATKVLSQDQLESSISSAIEQQYGFEVPVIVRTATEWSKTIEINPFVSEHKVDQLHLTFLGKRPTQKEIEAIKKIDTKNDTFEIINKHAFILLRNNYRESKLTNAFFEKQLKTKATTRNWKTMLKVNELLKKNQ